MCIHSISNIFGLAFSVVVSALPCTDDTKEVIAEFDVVHCFTQHLTFVLVMTVMTVVMVKN